MFQTIFTRVTIRLIFNNFDCWFDAIKEYIKTKERKWNKITQNTTIAASHEWNAKLLSRYSGFDIIAMICSLNSIHKVAINNDPAYIILNEKLINLFAEIKFLFLKSCEILGSIAFK